ncbi:hypothetical protein ACFSTC_53720 [Nonomuraea ferruginea]
MAGFAETAREQAEDVLARCFDPRLLGGAFVDRPGAAVTVRAQCDAIEIADLLLGRAPGPMPSGRAGRPAAILAGPGDGPGGDAARGRQPEKARSRLGGDAGWRPTARAGAVRSGCRLPRPVRRLCARPAGQPVPRAGPARRRHGGRDLIAFVESLPWTRDAWGAGHWVDILGTAMLWNDGRGRPGATEALFGWLLTRADPDTGMWGSARPIDGLLRIVNGFYRASRGTFAQFGVPLPYPERVVDTVLRHARDPRYVRPERQNACDILDIAHPLWLTRHTGYRAEEVTTLARTLLTDALGHWTDGQGFGFQAPHPTTAGVAATVPGLQGTEMWLAILWLLSDLAGVADALAYRPRGVHRPEPAVERPRTA